MTQNTLNTCIDAGYKSMKAGNRKRFNKEDWDAVYEKHLALTRAKEIKRRKIYQMADYHS